MLAAGTKHIDLGPRLFWFCLLYPSFSLLTLWIFAPAEREKIYFILTYNFILVFD